MLTVKRFNSEPVRIIRRKTAFSIKDISLENKHMMIMLFFAPSWISCSAIVIL